MPGTPPPLRAWGNREEWGVQGIGGPDQNDNIMMFRFVALFVVAEETRKVGALPLMARKGGGPSSSGNLQRLPEVVSL